MKHLKQLLLSLTLSLPLTVVVAAEQADVKISTAIQAAVDSPERSEADRARDALDHPAKLLAFAGIEPGMRVADVFAGGGYYSEILGRIVGDKGRVALINNVAYDQFAKAELKERLADGRAPNVEHLTVESCNLQLGDEFFDAEIIIKSLHDIYYADPANGWPAINAPHFLKQLHDGLKPGGVLLVVDHRAKDGTGVSAAQKLHRIDEAYLQKALITAGFVYDGTLDLYDNAEDDRSVGVFDPSIKGKTDRFVHRYRRAK